VVMKKEPLARYLIEQGANIHTSNLEKESAFVWALKHDMRPLILLLMEKGVLNNMPPDEGDDPFREILLKNPQLLLFLLNECPLNMRTCRSSLAGTIFDILHENPLPLLEGVSMSAEVSIGYEFDLLMAAVWTGREDLVARICEMSKNKVALKKGLLVAAIRNKKDIAAKYLFPAGVDPNAQDEGGRSALMIACISNSLDVAKLLIENQAKLNLQAQNGYTALMFAAMHDRRDIVALLLKKGARLEKKTRLGCTALNISILSFHLLVAQQLVNKGAKYGRYYRNLCEALKEATATKMAPELVSKLMGVHLPAIDQLQ